MMLRLATAAIGIPTLALFIWAGAPAFSALVAVAAGVGAWEVCRLAAERDRQPVVVVAVVWAVALVAVGHVLSEWQSDKMSGPDTTKALVVIVATAYVAWQTRRARGRVTLADWRYTAAAALYPGALLALAPPLRALDQGAWWVVLLVAVTFAADTAAFAVGRAVGRTPLAPSISPGKTWEGAVAGLAGAAVACVALVLVLDLGASLPVALLLGLLMGVAGQLGDLAESRLKRWADVKESGWMMPGHGGLLDRVDSIVFNLALVYPFVLWGVQ